MTSAGLEVPLGAPIRRFFLCPGLSFETRWDAGGLPSLTGPRPAAARPKDTFITSPPKSCVSR